jgi:four helix bundle protein
MHNFKELKVWQKAMDLACKTYQVTAKLPDSERFNLTSQARRSSVSVSSNIAEGAGRGTQADFFRFLDIAYGSSCELYTQLLLCEMLGFLNRDDITESLDQIDHIQKMITNLKRNS